ncbi:MAG TPA: right-handed parallel beta-helix repeat-containing protein, partial [Flavobacteriales bacterium]|nr:right-handed parallel beta-helix repeat-containing protein [Flavobacteriales bacterium]
MKKITNAPKLCSHPLAPLRYFIVLLSATLLTFTACKKDIRPDNIAGNKDVGQDIAQKNSNTVTLVVKLGESIQAAVNAVPDGASIRISPGTYYESVTVNKPGITLTGDGNVVLQNPGTASKGIIVLDGGDGFTLKHISIRNFAERAVDMTYVDGFLLSHITVTNNGEFGLFAEYCKNGTIEHCEGTGHSETGTFVGQSTNVNIVQNKMYGNVIGLEVENSSTIVMEKNQSFDNTVGIMCLLVPGRTVTQSANIVLAKNQVRDNNRINFSAPPEQESVLPSGLGILILGTDHTVIRDNHVTGNKFAGIATLSSLIMAQLAGIPEAYFAGINPNPDHLRVIGNQVKNNGYAPPANLPLPGADLLWDGSGTGNCWSKNLYIVSFPS